MPTSLTFIVQWCISWRNRTKGNNITADKSLYHSDMRIGRGESNTLKYRVVFPFTTQHLKVGSSVHSILLTWRSCVEPMLRFAWYHKLSLFLIVILYTICVCRGVSSNRRCEFSGPPPSRHVLSFLCIFYRLSPIFTNMNVWCDVNSIKEWTTTWTSATKKIKCRPDADGLCTQTTKTAEEILSRRKFHSFTQQDKIPSC